MICEIMKLVDILKVFMHLGLIGAVWIILECLFTLFQEQDLLSCPETRSVELDECHEAASALVSAFYPSFA